MKFIADLVNWAKGTNWKGNRISPYPTVKMSPEKRRNVKLVRAKFGYTHIEPPKPRIIWKSRLDGETLKECIQRMLKNKQTRTAILSFCLSKAPSGYSQKELEAKIRSSVRVEDSRLKP